MNTYIRFVNEPEEINKIVLDDWIYDRCSDDNCPDKEKIRDKNLYKDWFCVGCYQEENIIGLIGIHNSEHGPKIHIHMLKAYREHALKFATQTVKGLISIYGEFWAEIPKLYPDVLKFSEKVGFKEVRLIKNNYLKNGQLHDVHLMRYRDEFHR